MLGGCYDNVVVIIFVIVSSMMVVVNIVGCSVGVLMCLWNCFGIVILRIISVIFCSVILMILYIVMLIRFWVS